MRGVWGASVYIEFSPYISPISCVIDIKPYESYIAFYCSYFLLICWQIILFTSFKWERLPKYSKLFISNYYDYWTNKIIPAEKQYLLLIPGAGASLQLGFNLNYINSRKISYLIDLFYNAILKRFMGNINRQR